MMKLNKKIALLIAAIVLALAFSSCTAANTRNAVTLESDGSYCLDKAGQISSATKQYIEERNHNLEENCDGAQICAVVVNSTNSTNFMDYCFGVFSDWEIGNSEENNGMLIVFAIRDNKYWIVPGYGLQDRFDYDTIYEILEQYCKPDFEQRNYDAALKNTFSRVNEIVCSHYNCNPNGYANGSSFSGNGGSATPFAPLESCVGADSLETGIFCSACSCWACDGCGSCTGIGTIIFVLLGIYVLMEVLRGMGKGASRTNGNRSGGSGPNGSGGSNKSSSGNYGGSARQTNYGSFSGSANRTAGAGNSSASGTSGFRPRAWMFAIPFMIRAARRSTRGMGDAFRSFTGTPFGGTSRGPRPGGFRGGAGRR